MKAVVEALMLTLPRSVIDCDKVIASSGSYPMKPCAGCSHEKVISEYDYNLFNDKKTTKLLFF